MATPLLLWLMLGTTLSSPPSTEPERRVLFDFGPDDVSRWSTVHDTVMGGRSDGTLSRTEDETLVFSGNLSLKNNGGFTSFRSARLRETPAGTDGLELRVKGDGRTYIFSCDMRGVPIFAGGYWQEFKTTADTWTTVRLPWSAFEPVNFGEKLDGLPALDPAQLTAMGVYLYDKKEGPFALEVDAITAYTGEFPAAPSDADFAQDFPTLTRLVGALDLDTALVERNGRFTLLAPTDAAFEALPGDLFMELARPENADLLRSILLHHVMPERVTAAEAMELVVASSLEGTALSFRKEGSGLTIDGASVIATDLSFADGVAHVLDEVLIPSSVEAEIAARLDLRESGIGDATMVFALVETAELGSALADMERYTLFAPTDEAFAALPAETLEALTRPENRDALRQVLLNHVVAEPITAFAALQATVEQEVILATLSEGSITVASEGNELRIDGANVTRADILLDNGVVHLVDQVLVPDGLVLAEAPRTQVDGEAVRMFLVETVKRGASDFNSGDVEACASSYRTALEGLLMLQQVEDKGLVADIEGALDRAQDQGAREAAWTLRRAIDAVLRD